MAATIVGFLHKYKRIFKTVNVFVERVSIEIAPPIASIQSTYIQFLGLIVTLLPFVLCRVRLITRLSLGVNHTHLKQPRSVTSSLKSGHGKTSSCRTTHDTGLRVEVTVGVTPVLATWGSRETSSHKAEDLNLTPIWRVRDIRVLRVTVVGTTTVSPCQTSLGSDTTTSASWTIYPSERQPCHRATKEQV